jgi:Low molecular weight phosphotyrosine protein phosphatase
VSWIADARGVAVADLPEVLFVCVHNAGRSQMAAALLDHHANGTVVVRSAGSDPAERLNPAVVAAMAEVGIDLSREFPKPLTDQAVRAADVVITMGCPGRRDGQGCRAGLAAGQPRADREQLGPDRQAPPDRATAVQQAREGGGLVHRSGPLKHLMVARTAISNGYRAGAHAMAALARSWRPTEVLPGARSWVEAQ